MKQKLKGIYLLISSLVIGLLHLPMAFAKPFMGNRLPPKPTVSIVPLPAPAPMSFGDWMSPVKSVYDSLHLDLSGLSKQAFVCAQKGWKKLVKQGKVVNESIMAIIDFSQPSDHKRLYVLDMKNYKVLFNTLVAHGRNSGKEWARYFSNRSGSYKSSPGFYVTQETYVGNNGYSLKLNGVERGINDKALRRGIVMHGADYVSESFIEAQGYIGRSEGCPAVPSEEANEIIDSIKEGTCLFIYSPSRSYTSHSQILR